jgi:hypothetical protein
MIEVQVGLMAEEAMPGVLAGDRIPGPVRRFGVGKDDARAGVRFRRIAPDVEFAIVRVARSTARTLEPRVLIRGVVDDQLGDDPQTELVRGFDERARVAQRAVGGVDTLVLGDVVAVVAQRLGIERQQPDRRRAEVLDVGQLLDQAGEVADAVAITVGKRLDV